MAITSLETLLEEYARLPEYCTEMAPCVDIKSRNIFGDYPLNIAAARGATDEVSVLLEFGAPKNARGEHGYTPLMDAVAQGHTKVVKQLIDAGADPGLRNDDGDTAIDIASTMEETELFALLSRT